MLLADACSRSHSPHAAGIFDGRLQPRHGIHDSHSFQRKVGLSTPIILGGKSMRGSSTPGYVASMSGRGEYIGDVLVQLMDRKGLTPQELHETSGVSYNHIINLRQGNKRASASTMRKLATALGVAVARFVGTSTTTEPMGSANALGFVEFRTELAVPGTIEIVEPVGIFLAGDVVWVEAGEFTPDRWLLVEGVEGQVAIVKGIEEMGVKFMLTGRNEEIRFRPEAHVVRGVITRYERAC